MKRVVIAGLLAAAVALVATPAEARNKVLDQYCSPTGDYCTNLQRANGKTIAEVRTFSFTGTYQLCVNPPRAGRDCSEFRLRRVPHGIYQGRVKLARHFNLSRDGRYTVSFRYGGDRLGQALHFRKG